MELGISLILVVVLLLILKSTGERPPVLGELRDVPLDPERLRLHAGDIAKAHETASQLKTARMLLERLEANFDRLTVIYRYLNDKAKETDRLSPASEWILDNYYIIEEQAKEAGQLLRQERHAKLPVLNTGPLKGYPRIYAIALELISHTDGRLDQNELVAFLAAYQEYRVLRMAELWSLALMLKVALLEYLRHLADKIVRTENQWTEAEQVARLAPEDRLQRVQEILVSQAGRQSSSFVVQLVRELRKKGDDEVLHHRLEQYLLDYGTDLDTLVEQEHFEQASRKITVGNGIVSLKNISLLNWEDVFEALSRVELLLNGDPAQVYRAMDPESRDYYRRQVGQLARRYGVPETRVARIAVALAKQNENRKSPLDHVGYYLLGEGRKELIKGLTGKSGAHRFHDYPSYYYYGAIIALTLVLVLPLAWYSFRLSGGNPVFGVAALLLALLPLSEAAVFLVNRMAAALTAPAFLPKLAFEEGIPAGEATMVVIPALLPNPAKVGELLERLETYYLANREDNLYFALAGDFKDSGEKTTPEDEAIIQAGLRGVQRLNREYGEGRELFFYCQRERVLCPTQGRWTGWERKRGALVEFNRLLLGEQDTTFRTVSPGLDKITGKIKYVITLDADTRLTIDTAKKLIGAMAHPLHRPVICPKKGTVIKGYGLIQPRIGIGIESANQSAFTRLFAGAGGIDPYTTAVSDVYQDLFGEGIFTGKGIYDLRVFQEVLAEAIPEGCVLSHDLLEGSYLRVGLATDVELIDGYPGTYSAYAARQHRWVRGDWQLLPWLFSRVRNRQGQPVKNPLSPLSKWKMFDNLRRSMVPVGQFLLLLGGLLWLPGNPLIWLAVALLPQILPVLAEFLQALKAREPRYALQGFRNALLQGLLLVVFLPHQAGLMVDAAVRTIYRVFVSRRELLEWVTAADVEKSLKNDLTGFLRRMRVGLVVGIAVLPAVVLVRPSGLVYALPFALLWLGSPWVAYQVSLAKGEHREPISEADERILRRLARRTWAFYEDFANEENNYLPPDNYQVDPPNGLAHRTSPTNIGFLFLSYAAARDFGYLTTTGFIRRVQATLATMAKMETWRGHLLNWYDTRTLEPLRPYFISTVDSGNLAGYLLVVKKAVEDYLTKPLWGPELVKGLKDTYCLAFPGEQETTRDWDRFAPVELLEYLDTLPLTEGTWQVKLKEMVAALKKERQALFPDPELLRNLKEREIGSDLLALLDQTPGPVTLEEVYRGLLGKLEGLTETERQVCQAELEGLLSRVEVLVKEMEDVIQKLDEIFRAMDFRPLYDDKHHLFAIGYNKEEEKITNSYYDLLASEARLISYLAICKREVPKEHWFKLGRALSEACGRQGLVSWTGTMFEYFMPPLVMKHYPATLLHETYRTVLKAQKLYGDRRGVPWGTSESGYYAFDLQLNYQYKAFGVPDLGLKRGLIEDMVVSPYSTLLALPFTPQEAMANIRRLLKDGLEGEYGLYEAVDYTPERLPAGEHRKVVASFMAHHLGMSLAAINNLLHDGVLQRRFHANPLIRSGEILLEEKVPARAIITKDYKEEVHPLTAGEKETVDFARSVEVTGTRELPHCHLLSNGRYSLLLTEGGSGYSRREGIQLTRWRSDILRGSYGFQLFLKSLETGKVWNPSFEPLKTEADSCQATFLLGKAVFVRRDDLLTTHTEVLVAPEDDVEIRRVIIANDGPHEVILELTSFIELVLGDHQGDLAHPAFSSLFVKTETLPEEEILLASRRPRSQHQPTHWAFHSLVVEGETIGQLQYETNRGSFLGRNRTLAEPQALEKPLSGMTGTVLDPIFSLRRRVRVKPEETVTLTWLFGYGETREQALALAGKYRQQEVINRAFEIAETRSQVEAQFLNLTGDQIALYQDLLSHLMFTSPLKAKQGEQIAGNRKGQPGLWAYGISGDHPIVLVTVESREGLETVKEMLKAHEYWRMKGLTVDLVILNEDNSRYLQPLQDLLRDTVAISYARHLLDRPGGIFLRQSQSMPEEDRLLFFTVARLVIDAKLQIRAQLCWRERQLPSRKEFARKRSLPPGPEETVDLQLWNGYGGFNRDGKEYVIRLREGINTPAPWLNVIANRQFGFQISESGAGFTWAENSRENKLTQWSNDPVTDPPGETLYLRDEDTGAIWTVTPQPVREETAYTVHHGLGYTRFHHHSHGLEQEQTVFVSLEDPVKVTLLGLTNHTQEARTVSLFYFLRPVLGVHEEITAPYLVTGFNPEEQIFSVRNAYQSDFPDREVFVGASEQVVSYTGDRREFLGPRGQQAQPEGLARENLSNQVGAGLDPCAALQVTVTIRPGEQKELVFLLGQAQQQEQAVRLVRHYRDPERAKKALEQVKSYWETTLSVVQVRTPDSTMDLMMNGWLMYQNIACRLWARSAFYQSGGAYGYRDQLQDSLNAIYIDPEITKGQLLLHAAHQFKEGDVLHWWHPGAGDRGVRTRFSDDRLWLPYVLVEYLERTEDYGILTLEAPFLEGEELAPGEDETYFTPSVSPEKGTLYEHCVRAIEISLRFGDHGLPLMGSGDWNDGMSTVGNRGRGESVWLGWFLYYILKKFVPVCLRMEDYRRAAHFEEMIRHLAGALEEAGWDGAWYRRAYFDDGTPLGSAANSECSIDSLAQSWAVIAGGEREERQAAAMAAVEQNLVDRDLGLIKLFTPPFEKGDLEPGYIKGYVAGVRENGAQYTHAAIWVIKAFAMLGQGDKAGQLFHMINPVNHARTPIECAVYKVEPYVVPADVYTVSPQEGRGGWTWYTGAAGWLYRVGLEDILGFKLQGNKLCLNPCIPKEWPGFEINYRYGKTLYQIVVENPHRVNRGVGALWVDGQPAAEGISLVDDGQTHQVRVVLDGTNRHAYLTGNSAYVTE